MTTSAIYRKTWGYPLPITPEVNAISDKMVDFIGSPEHIKMSREAGERMPFPLSPEAVVVPSYDSFLAAMYEMNLPASFRDEFYDSNIGQAARQVSFSTSTTGTPMSARDILGYVLDYGYDVFTYIGFLHNQQVWFSPGVDLWNLSGDVLNSPNLSIAAKSILLSPIVHKSTSQKLTRIVTVGQLAFAAARCPQIPMPVNHEDCLQFVWRFEIISKAIGLEALAWTSYFHSQGKLDLPDVAHNSWESITGLSMVDWLVRCRELGVSFDLAQKFLAKGVYNPGHMSISESYDVDTDILDSMTSGAPV
jgi:hypothetical protein